MKLILGDNQFFGVNHADLLKASKTRDLFETSELISNFINTSMDLGMDGFMMNSNELGFKVIEEFDFLSKKLECHYSIPYPHKYAGIVNESGMISLISLVLGQLSIRDIFPALKFILSMNASHLLPIILRMEIPKSLPKGSVIYLQNVVTDLIMGQKNGDRILSLFIDCVSAMGFKPGFITLNPNSLYKILESRHNSEEILICFNANYSNFNLFPSQNEVEQFILDVHANTKWQLMGMSIFSSGSKGISIEQSIEYIKALKLDYVVFGSSNLNNIKSNIDYFKRP